MSNVKNAFANGKAFIPFITCVDPDLETTAAAVRAAAEGGASLIELGIPFSDPTAEGPVIQGANLRALRGGVTTDVGAMVRLVKEANPDIPCAVGFGISTPGQAKKMAGLSDDAIVGFAIIKLLEKYGADAPGYIGEYVKSMAEAVAASG